MPAELDRSGASGERLVVEIPETTAIADLQQTLRCMEVLRARGCRFAVDDFSTGFSSLYYLKRLPADFLKMDGAFIRGLAVDAENREIVKAIAGLARGLGKKSAAKWVEDEATLRVVREPGVDSAQGWCVGRPVPVSEMPFRFSVAGMPALGERPS